MFPCCYFCLVGLFSIYPSTVSVPLWGSSLCGRPQISLPWADPALPPARSITVIVTETQGDQLSADTFSVKAGFHLTCLPSFELSHPFLTSTDSFISFHCFVHLERCFFTLNDRSFTLLPGCKSAEFYGRRVKPRMGTKTHTNDCGHTPKKGKEKTKAMF